MINPRELEILSILAKSEEPMTSSQIVNAGDMLSQSTVQTVLRKLLKAKLIKVCDVVYSGNVLSRTYKPTEECKEAVLRDFMEFYSVIEPILPNNEAVAALGGGKVKASDFANAVVTMLQYEKESFLELIGNEDWDALADEIYEYVTQCD